MLYYPDPMSKSLQENTDFRFALNDALKIFFKDAIKVSIKHPSQALYFIKTYRWQKKAAKTREKWEQEVTFSSDEPGAEKKIEFLLYEGTKTEPSRTLHIIINVVNPTILPRG